MTDFIILAAGNGRRMNSCATNSSKLFKKIAGLSIVSHVINNCRNVNSGNVIIVTQEQYKEREEFRLADKIAIQKAPLGTADAVKAALPFVESESAIIICGDSPLIQADDLRLLADTETSNVSIVVMQIPNDMLDSQYGRVFVDSSEDVRIVEYNDLSDEQKRYNIVNSGIYKFKTLALLENIEKIKLNADKNEYYLTDIFQFIKSGVNIITAKNYKSFLGINTPRDFVIAEDIMQNRLRDKFINNGVTMLDPPSVYLSYDTVAEPLSTIEQNVIIKGGVKIKAGAVIRSFSYLENCVIGKNAKIGPSAVIRDSVVEEHAEIGNFVEVKRSTIGNSTKSKHLAYIGDTDVGENSNIGAGTITCNYDGRKKHKTKIGSKTMVGANSSLIAPVEIGSEAVIAAGSVITKDVPDKTLAFGRARQENKTRKEIA
ncbi:MAG: bifunctional UDP-N-acetylglucosamine diphosphorylase/glucosamine-1-phosphate N-acetyltransferase GlmU [Holosporales bacterium]|jgi:bifunctional UDP-N-acetylglucosamine pyrophosphorylase/glucosamine-1-phosphate N-acetyltransferase|nr:bifunctional UDP-N-acetylglucosamine diphosphorylase/glucosamine-1-phosphate N-acetyltransferase GlmU [Holosporales bacterium]